MRGLGRRAHGKADVLILNQYYPPDRAPTAQLLHELALLLCARGRKVTVLCGRPSYDVREARGPISRRRSPGLRICEVPSTAFSRRSLVGRTLNYATFLLAGALWFPWVPARAIVVGSDPPLSVIVAAFLSRRPIIYWMQDMHPDMAVAAGLVKPGLVTHAWEKVHVAATRRCTWIVCPGGDMAQRLMLKGVPAGRIRVVPNGAAVAPFKSFHHQLVEELRRDSPFVIVHAGNIGAAGDWLSIAEAARLTEDTARWVFVGEGIGERQLADCPVVRMPFRPSADIPAVMAASDMQLVTMKQHLSGVLVPSKAYTALAHGRPLLAVVPEDCELAGMVRRSGCGVVVAPGQPEQLAAAVRWLSQEPAVVERMRENAQRSGEGCTRDATVSALADIVEGRRRRDENGPWRC